MITSSRLSRALNIHIERAAKWLDALNSAMAQYGISTPARQAAFLAQVGHESGRLVYVREIWNPAKCLWQAKYEGRADLGNIKPGDGERFKGRGLIQITGRSNYRACGKALGIDLESQPELLERTKYAALSAGWFWDARGCNELADKGDFKAITRKINGGYNGMVDRMALFESAKAAIA